MSEGSTWCTDTESAYVFDLQDWETWLNSDAADWCFGHYSVSYIINNVGGGGGEGGGDELITMHCQLEGWEAPYLPAVYLSL